MADTAMVDRGGRRVRIYVRKTAGPRRSDRLTMAGAGLGWCRHCAGWSEGVRAGLCRWHRNADYRRRYAGAGGQAIRARVHARKRGIAPVSAALAADATELFGGRCAYCPAASTTWDHLVAVANGGATEAGNIVPACVSCNSRKRCLDPIEFTASLRPGLASPALFEAIATALELGVL